MINLRDLIREVAEPEPQAEKDFWKKHKIEVIKHPVAPESQFKGVAKKDKSKKASYHNGEDERVYEQVGLIEHSADFHRMANEFHQEKARYHAATAGAFHGGDAKRIMHIDAAAAHLAAGAGHSFASRVHNDPKWHSKQGHGTPKAATSAASDLSKTAEAATKAAHAPVEYLTKEGIELWDRGTYVDIVEHFLGEASYDNTADRRPQKYQKPDGRMGIRMVPTAMNIIKTDPEGDEKKKMHEASDNTSGTRTAAAVGAAAAGSLVGSLRARLGGKARPGAAYRPTEPSPKAPAAERVGPTHRTGPVKPFTPAPSTQPRDLARMRANAAAGKPVATGTAEFEAGSKPATKPATKPAAKPSTTRTVNTKPRIGGVTRGGGAIPQPGGTIRTPSGGTTRPPKL